MSLNDILVCSIIKYFCGVVYAGGLGQGGGGGRWLWGACVLKSNCYPVILRDKISLSYNPFAKLTQYKVNRLNGNSFCLFLVAFNKLE